MVNTTRLHKVKGIKFGRLYAKHKRVSNSIIFSCIFTLVHGESFREVSNAIFKQMNQNGFAHRWTPIYIYVYIRHTYVCVCVLQELDTSSVHKSGSRELKSFQIKWNSSVCANRVRWYSLYIIIIIYVCFCSYISYCIEVTREKHCIDAGGGVTFQAS